MAEDRSFNRRRFFRDGLRELLRPLAGTVEKFEDAARQFSEIARLDALEAAPQPTAPPPAPPSPPAPPTAPAVFLRPPGAVEESRFQSLCTKCNECVKVCPVQAIRLSPDGPAGEGLPYIDPEVTACAVCEGLNCMKACPTGALLPLERTAINMGRAVWDDLLCMRPHGEYCQMCVDHCPIGPTALSLDEERVIVGDGCVGCGVCQSTCPTYPRAITVTPRGK